MNKPTQLEKLLKEEEQLIRYIQELKEEVQSDIDAYEGDLSEVRRLITDLNTGKNNNAWASYLDIVNSED